MAEQPNLPEPATCEEKAIRDLCVGRVEWRCSTDDGAYCMSFDRDNSLNPEREANEWLERHQRDYPHRFMAYKVRRVVVQSQLQEAALALLSRLSDAQLLAAEVVRLRAVKQAISDYHYALDMRQHGGVAQDRAFNAICKALDMHWAQGAEKTRRAALDASRLALKEAK